MAIIKKQIITIIIKKLKAKQNTSWVMLQTKEMRINTISERINKRKDTIILCFMQI
jgi:hypothetical protein